MFLFYLLKKISIFKNISGILLGEHLKECEDL